MEYLHAAPSAEAPLFDAAADADLVDALHDLALSTAPETAALYAAAVVASANRPHEARAVARSARLCARLEDAVACESARLFAVLRSHACATLADALASACGATVVPARSDAPTCACAGCGVTDRAVAHALLDDTCGERAVHTLCARCAPVLAAVAQLCHTALFARAALGTCDHDTRLARARECAAALRASASVADVLVLAPARAPERT